MSTATHISQPLPISRVDTRALPGPLAAWLTVMLAVSSVVLIEPAPCDVLFAVGFPLALLAGYLALPKNVNHLLYLGWFCFLLANLISTAFSIDGPRAARYLAINFYMVTSWFVYVAVTGRYGRAAYDIIYKGFNAAALLAVAVGLLTFARILPFADVFFRDESMQRIKATFKDPNVFAPFLVAAAIITLANVVARGKATLSQAVMLLLYFTCILLAFSRGAFVHLIVSVFVFISVTLLVNPQPKALNRLLKAVLPLAILTLLLGGVILTQTELGDFFVKRMTIQKYDNQRFGMQELAFEIVTEYPLGMGPGQWFRGRFPKDVHNLYLRVWSENGILAICSLAFFVAVWIHCVWRAIKRRTPLMTVYIACLAIVIGILVESIVIDTIHWRHFYLFLAIPIGLAAHESMHGQEIHTTSDGGPQGDS